MDNQRDHRQKLLDEWIAKREHDWSLLSNDMRAQIISYPLVVLQLGTAES
jgi:hypothetical protein